MSLVIRDEQRLPDHLEYAADYLAEMAYYAEWSGCSRGLWKLDECDWVQAKHDGHRAARWDLYRHDLSERFGSHTVMRAMNPDGSFRPWSPGELEP